MMHIDQMAYSSKLADKPSEMKMILSGATLILCMWGDSIMFSMVIFVMMFYLSAVVGGIPVIAYLKLLFLPGIFMIMALVGIAVDVAKTSELLTGAISLGSWYIGISKVGLITAIQLFFRAMGAASCLFFLILTTPFSDILSTLKRWHVPMLLLELSELTYRFIFVLLETGDKIRIAQNNRLGYRGVKNSFRSLGILISSVFVRSLKRSEDIYCSLESRGYNGTLVFLEEESKLLKLDLAFLIAWIIGLMVLMIHLKNIEGVLEWIR
jgi:cobalt/nickel transport system permease protein